MASTVHFIIVILCSCQYSLSINISEQYSNWQAPTSPLLPRAAEGIAICYKNGSILMFGGQPQGFNRQLIRYQISTGQFIDYGETALAKEVQSNAQYYAQINNMFYWLQFLNGDYKIIVYNLSDHNINYNNVTMDKFQTITPTYGHLGIACLASNNDLLFVSGGYDGISQYLNEVQIYNISSQIWITNVPKMQTQRGSHSCIFDPIHNELYQIGGTTLKPGFVYDNVYSVEKILIDDIVNQNWIYIENLTYPVSNTRAVMYKDTILIIGGLYANYTSFEQHYIDKIHMINTSTGHVSISGVLNYSVAQTAAIVVNDTIYSFGGVNNNGVLNKWQYMDDSILSINSTALPTTALPTTLTPTTINPTVSSTIALQTTTSPITSTPTTTDPTTPNPVTFSPTIMHTLFNPNSTPFYSISITISFMYDLDANSSDSLMLLQIIKKTILKISTADKECVLFQDASSESNAASTNFNITVSLCDKQTQQILIAAIQISQDLKTDLLKNINNQTNLFVSHDDMSLSIDKIFGNELFSNSTSTLATIENTNQNYVKEEDDAWIYVLIAGGILLICLLLIIFVLCAYKCKKMDEQQLDTDGTMGKHGDDQQTTYGMCYNLETNENHKHPSIQMNEMSDICINTVTPGNEVHSPKPETLSTVKSWIGTTVQLPKYYDVFIENGYETMDIIQEIKDISELEDMGIDNMSDQMEIMAAIQQLSEREVETNKVEGECTLKDTFIIQSDSEEYQTKGNESNEGITREKEIKFHYPTPKEQTQTAQ